MIRAVVANAKITATTTMAIELPVVLNSFGGGELILTLFVPDVVEDDADMAGVSSGMNWVSLSKEE